VRVVKQEGKGKTEEKAPKNQPTLGQQHRTPNEIGKKIMQLQERTGNLHWATRKFSEGGGKNA